MTVVLEDISKIPKEKRDELNKIIEDTITKNENKEKFRENINVLMEEYCMGDYLVNIINSGYDDEELKEIGFEKQSLFDENNKEFLGYKTIRGTLLFRKTEKDNGKYSKYCIKI